MIGELTKGSCSLYGAWGQATASEGSPLMQLRALDWDVVSADLPVRTRAHPAAASTGSSYTHAWLASRCRGFSALGNMRRVSPAEAWPRAPN